MKKLLSIFAFGGVLGQDLDFADVFDHVCDETSMTASIRERDLERLGTWGNDFSKITLNEGCSGVPDEYGNILFNAGSLQNLPLECGTQYWDDGQGKITFWNVVQFTPPNDGSPITRDADGLYNFTCVYDMSVNDDTFELSLKHKVVAAPVDTIWFEGQTAEGKFRATMELFKDDSYDESFMGSSVMLSVEQRLYVDVTLEAKDPEVVLNVQRCWATPTTEADAPVRHTLIYEGCPTDPTVVLRDDAPDANSARWESQMFQFVDEAQVWLHCDIQACDSRRFSCENTCEDRERREIEEIFSGARHPRAVSTPNASGTGMYNPNILTVGPLRSQERWADSTIGSETQALKWIVAVGVLVILALVSGIVYFCKFRESASVKPKTRANNDWQLYGAGGKPVGAQNNGAKAPRNW
jgi:hypothetical protein